MISRAFIFMAWLLGACVLLAPGAARAAEPGEELTIYLMTMQPGDEIFEQFAHDIIWVRDSSAQTDVAYNWGIFDFNQESFLIKFLFGRMDYWMEGFSTAGTIDYYRSQNRSIWAQELNLTPAQRVKVRDFLQWNERPENKFYRYNYYNDNCATRARDVIDMALGGQLRKQLEATPTSNTYRWHTRRLTQGNVFWYSALNAVLGPNTDRKLSAWDDAFLPVTLRDHLRSVSITTADGRSEPLVKREITIFRSTRPNEPISPPNWIAQFFIFGLFVGALFIATMYWAKRKRLGKIAFVLVTSAYLLPLGAGGLFAVWAWIFSDHWSVYRNENLFGYSPLMLILALLIVLMLCGVKKAVRPARWLAIVIAASTVLGLLVKTLPWFRQVNAEPMAMVLPANIALAWAVCRLASSKTTETQAGKQIGREPQSNEPVQLSPHPQRSS